MEKLQGKTAFVTGGASGIGLGIAKACARQGMQVVIADARKQAVDEALKYFAEKEQAAHGIVFDVTDRAAYAEAADEAEGKYGNIHVLINNAGVAAGGGAIYDASYKDWDFILGINVTGVFNGIVTIVPRIIKHGEGGHVVATSSTGGAFAVTGSALYCTTKYAVSGMMECLAADLVGTNVGASVFYPGPVNSNLGISSMQVRPENLKNEDSGYKVPELDEKGAKHEFPDFSKIFMTPEEVGERVVRGIKRGDLFIWTHPEFKAGMQVRCDAVLKAFPDEPENEKRAEALKTFGTLLYNPVYESQTTPGAPDWD